MKILVKCENCGSGYTLNDLEFFKCVDCGGQYYRQVPGDVPKDDQCECGSGYGSYWEKDGRGIPLCKVCVECREKKLSKYEPWVLGYYSEEDCGCAIEPEDYY
jgi:hypothetical protein